MILHFPYFFAFSLIAGVAICVLFSFLAGRRPAEDIHPHLGKGRIVSAILIWLVALFMLFTATTATIVSEAFTNPTFYDRYERVMMHNDFSQENLLTENTELSLDEQKLEIRNDLWVNANMRIGIISCSNVTFILIALGLYVLRFRSSSTTWREKLTKVIGYALLLYIYLDHWTLLGKILRIFAEK